MVGETSVQQLSESHDEGLLGEHGIKVVKQWFHNEVIEIDGWHFVGCRFDGCKLIIKTANVALERCMVDKTTKFHIKSSVVTPVQAYNSELPIIPGFEYFWPDYHEDGTISIGVE